jgi:hypothetical protein
METTISTISNLPSNREQGMAFYKSLKGEILSGTKDPLKLLVALKVIEKTISDILKDDDVEYCFQKEFFLYDKEKTITVSGAKLSMSETGVRYDYEGCGDPVWNDLNKAQNDIKEKMKEREKFLQSIPVNTPGIVDADSGVFINRPSKTSKTKVKVQL